MSHESMSRPLVGVAVFVRRDGRYLIGHRTGSHAAGTWGLPGGHLEYGETFIDACARETFEETDLSISDIQKLTFRNNIFPDGRHYVTLFFTAVDSGDRPLKNKEDKHDEWRWVTLDEMRKFSSPTLGDIHLSPLFAALQDVLDDPSVVFPQDGPAPSQVKLTGYVEPLVPEDFDLICPPEEQRFNTIAEFVQAQELQIVVQGPFLKSDGFDLGLYGAKGAVNMWQCQVTRYDGRRLKLLLRTYPWVDTCPSFEESLASFKGQVKALAEAEYHPKWDENQKLLLVTSLLYHRHFFGEADLYKLLLIKDENALSSDQLPTDSNMKRTGVFDQAWQIAQKNIFETS